MKSTSKWVNNKQSVLTNGRSHNAVVDLPESSNGDDMSYSALEMCLMSLAGCITTIYSVVAEKEKLELIDMEVSLEAEKGGDTLTDVEIHSRITTKSDKDLARKVYDEMMDTYPVGILFRKAGVKMKHNLQILVVS